MVSNIYQNVMLNPVKFENKCSCNNKVVLKPVTISDLKTNKPVSNKKVSLGEAFSLIKCGLVDKAKEIYNFVVSKPIKVFETMGAIAGGLSALPLIGVSAVSGAAVLALGFFTFSTGKTVKNVYKAIQHNKDGDYVELRKDLHNLGGNSLHLLLSLPFLPKAFKDIKFFSQNTAKLGLNQELIDNIKHADSFFAMIKEFFKGHLSILKTY